MNQAVVFAMGSVLGFAGGVAFQMFVWPKVLSMFDKAKKVAQAAADAARAE